MSKRSAITRLDTHEVTNQPPPFPEINLYESDPLLQDAVEREGAGWAMDRLQRLGEVMGRDHTLALANDANRHEPELHSFDPQGRRIDEVAYHPAYHQLMALAREHEIHSIAWTAEQGGHVAHTALEYLFAQIEGGVCCPVTMTYAAVPALRQASDQVRAWLPKLLASHYDSAFVPAADKQALTIGMAMTEKQGGSDLRTNSTTATALENDWYSLRGHKWFCSAPMSDCFLTLAQTDDGPTCFMVPRWLPDGERNRFFIQRLKDKLGNRSNASSEIEYDDTLGQRVGEPGRGIATIMTMVKHTRLDTCLAPVALMRQTLVRAVHHARHREAFGAMLSDQPLMRALLSDLALELEAGVALLFRVARSFDEADEHEGDSEVEAFSRLAAALAKFHLNKVAPGYVCEALEVLGGGGYVEESILPRLYREAPLNSIWEGSGNVICLDVLRTLGRHGGCLDLLFAELDQAAGRYDDLDRAVASLKKLAADSLSADRATLEASARHLTETMAVTWQGALLARFAPPAVAEGFCRTRLGQGRGRAYGTQSGALDNRAVIARILA